MLPIPPFTGTSIPTIEKAPNNQSRSQTEFFQIALRCGNRISASQAQKIGNLPQRDENKVKNQISIEINLSLMIANLKSLLQKVVDDKLNTGWWLNHPSEKNMLVKLKLFPNLRGENKKCVFLKPPPR